MKKLCSSGEREQWEKCEKNSSADQGQWRGRGGGAPGTRTETLLQPVEKTMAWKTMQTLVMATHHGVVRGKSCVINFISSYDKVAHLVNQGKLVDVIFLYLSKAFNVASYSIFLDEMSSKQPDKYGTWWVDSSLMGRSPGAEVNVVTSSWWPVTSRFPLGYILGSILFNVFINDLEAGLECMLIKFPGDTKLG